MRPREFNGETTANEGVLCENGGGGKQEYESLYEASGDVGEDDEFSGDDTF